MSATPTEIAETFIAHWNANRVEEALAMLSDDVLYDNVPYPDITGRHNVRGSISISGWVRTSERTGRS
ncbi:hypothetical protein [Streptomyces sp. NPDC005303]|uniref:hypothetical protein n=1 Tax=Streptomyces sp. NPDC005303 TaxID=3155713 RepID=UPI0033AF3B8A